MNEIAQLVFELTCNYITVQYISHYVTEALQRERERERKREREREINIYYWLWDQLLLQGDKKSYCYGNTKH